ncbi:hypothetical protein [Pyrococcus kukulkanii]|uniref:SLAC1 family transporter n=1 Tax=Pyrococcus kukulkanii TaxID=1609559 RepID=UPI00356ABBFD
MAVMLTLYYIRKISLHYSLAWWAFIFPLGAYTSVALKVASLLSSPTIKVFGVLLYGMLFVLWLITGAKTIIHLTSSSLRGFPQLRTVAHGSPSRLASSGTARVPS